MPKKIEISPRSLEEVQDATLDSLVDQVICGDCREEMRKLPAKCVDLVFADPPYNLQLKGELWRPNLTKVDAVNDRWDQFGSYAEYDQFTREWLAECRRVLKDTGTLWVIGSYHNIFRIGAILQDLGYWVLNDVVWLKANPTPQMRGKRLCNAHETLIWAKKSEKQTRYTFHYHSLKAGNEDKQMRSDWYFPICAGAERLTQNGRKAHATQKPEALVRRIVQATSNPGDLVLDPFCGTGTTAAVAKSLGRRFITIDKEEAYVGLAEKRLAAIDVLPMEVPLDTLPSRHVRVPFVTLVETGLLKPGDTLHLKGKPVRAVIHADGTISTGDHRGSIHKVGALCMNVPSCNGWTSWLYTDSKTQQELPIDHLRQQIAGE